MGITSPGDSGGPASAIRAQIDKILDSETLAQAPMLRRLLRYLAEQTLDGRGHELKEYGIAVDVFDRGSDFDPRTDTIVRVQARRLRAKLDDYYRREGAADPFRIDVPKGRYLVECRQTGTIVADTTPASRDERASIVVLPFVNLNDDPETDFFTDGLTEELIGALASVAELKVVARTSAFHFKGRTDDIRTIGKELGVRTALEGSVRTDSQRMRVTAQLIDLADGLHLWSEIYDRTRGSVFDIQEEIATAIVQALRVRLAPGERAKLRPEGPENADAYDHYLKGRYFMFRFTPADIQKSVEHLQQAIALAPTYAAAHASLAEAHLIWSTFQAEPPAAHFAPAREAALRALARAPSAEAHAAMGWVLALVDFDWQGSQREFRRALALKPSSGAAHSAYATCCLCPMRRYGEAVDHLVECVSIDPLSTIMRVMLGQTLLLAQRFDDAVRELRHALALDPDFAFAHVTLALAYLGTGSYQNALDTLLPVESAAGVFPNFWGHLGFAHAKMGNRIEAERALRVALERFAPWVPGVDAAAIYNALGETQLALEWLEQAHRERSLDSLFIDEDPRFVNLRSDSAFLRLVTPAGA